MPKKIIKINDVNFIEYSGSIEKDLDMRPSGRNGSVTSVVMANEFSRSPLFDEGGQSVDGNERVGGSGVAIEEPYERAPSNDVIVESFGEGRAYGNHSEIGTKTTFYLNVMRNGRVWQYLKIL